MRLRLAEHAWGWEGAIIIPLSVGEKSRSEERGPFLCRDFAGSPSLTSESLGQGRDAASLWQGWQRSWRSWALLSTRAGPIWPSTSQLVTSPLLSSGLTQAGGHRCVPPQPRSPQAECPQVHGSPSEPLSGQVRGELGVPGSLGMAARVAQGTKVRRRAVTSPLPRRAACAGEAPFLD